jgi:hypothetical protein
MAEKIEDFPVITAESLRPCLDNPHTTELKSPFKSIGSRYLRSIANTTRNNIDISHLEDLKYLYRQQKYTLPTKQSPSLSSIQTQL